MRKKIGIATTIFFLIFPLMAQAITVNTAEDIVPSDVIVAVDLQLAGKLKTFLEPLINNQLRQQLYEDASGRNDRAKIRLLLGKILDGGRLFFSAANEAGSLVSTVTDNEWETLINRAQLHTYNSTNVYEYEDMLLAKLDNYAIIGSENAVHDSIDLYTGSSTNSLTSNAAYQSMVSSYPSPRLFSATVNFGALTAIIGEITGGNGTNDTNTQAMTNLLSIIDMYGLSVSDTPTGYSFLVKVKGNPEYLATQNYSFNPGGSFTPNLYAKFPNAKPILYTESFNPKAESEQSQRLLENLQQTAGDNQETNIFNVYETIEQQTGLNPHDILNLFDKETAFAVQYSPTAKIPYFTLMANVSSNRQAAETQMNNIVDLLNATLRTNPIPANAYEITRIGSSTAKLSINPNELPGVDVNGIDQIVVTFTVTNDNLLIISNYPDIENPANRTGVASDADFAAVLPNFTAPNSGIVYLNTRNLWEYIDSLLEWFEEISGSVPLEFYRGYYGLLDKIYAWKDLYTVTQGTSNELTMTGNITIDQTAHKTLAQLLSEMRVSDSDNDNVSDYEERFWNMPVVTQDSDDDGRPDAEALQRGFNPRGGGRFFTDVPENTYYTRDVSFLRQKGAIAGYANGSFQPGRIVNRAEFVTMVVKAFEKDSSVLFGLNLDIFSEPPPFTDIDPVSWYYQPVSKAYGAGLISGGAAPDGRLIFRPGDPITRAEALTILNRASNALARTGENASCDQTPFNDVSPNDWFCAAVGNGYANGITSGKTPHAFKPFDSLNRAEAAVMIKRSLEKDIEISR